MNYYPLAFFIIKSKILKILHILFFTIIASSLFAQKVYDPKDVIQFTGKVVTAGEEGEIVPLSYVNVAVEGTTRGALSEYDGYFSFVALKGEKVIFSRIGFKSVEYIIPDTLRGDFYSWIQIMSTDNVLLPEVVIYPWPSREHFKQDLLAMDVSTELKENARQNMAAEVLREMRYTVPADGRETSSYAFKQIANQAVYTGQIRPQKIFDVFAWKQFIQAWKRGDFKNKDTKD